MSSLMLLLRTARSRSAMAPRLQKQTILQSISIQLRLLALPVIKGSWSIIDDVLKRKLISSGPPLIVFVPLIIDRVRVYPILAAHFNSLVCIGHQIHLPELLAARNLILKVDVFVKKKKTLTRAVIVFLLWKNVMYLFNAVHQWSKIVSPFPGVSGRAGSRAFGMPIRCAWAPDVSSYHKSEQIQLFWTLRQEYL